MTLHTIHFRVVAIQSLLFVSATNPAKQGRYKYHLQVRESTKTGTIIRLRLCIGTDTAITMVTHLLRGNGTAKPSIFGDLRCYATLHGHQGLLQQHVQVVRPVWSRTQTQYFLVTTSLLWMNQLTGRLTKFEQEIEGEGGRTRCGVN